MKLKKKSKILVKKQQDVIKQKKDKKRTFKFFEYLNSNDQNAKENRQSSTAR